ncbi:valine--pyruvate transaminase [Leptospira sp. 2 VSF19]|uniref:Valine--pyruvate transaminase n=1 Tax=Leptospira soteropolitanensis TaxID=2950025 RepID=A0AAW5VGT5_9LEPT|nr:valine--pyruvate transaminase [Leptospira soteropolitanensis]MCW7494368.1 valine--pyruvate transaminase [Leptospira soteropolitanensis]MCW7501923.1 valine--pyruvate transaminase [Leptospira soteropolitanensis]MCW7524214.1 valine--pyruvate transaminase [Leptospira soteropolitanensis]MCW7528079.1 valine--pyruvate transaminase [Leptospira soteropolitanensis]MCW7531933.1 valine--pyruvate transaminase [Leptospira soteropolitanensis]
MTPMKDSCASLWASRLRQNQGIRSLMEDLGQVTGHPEEILLGGGNPAHIREAEDIFTACFQSLASDPNLKALLGDYQAPIGNDRFRALAAEYLSPHLDANLRKDNIAFFNGSQNAYSFLLNIHSGKMIGGNFKKILLPIVPEYIGYADQSIEADVFLAKEPEVIPTGKHRFRYGFNKENFDLSNIGCVVMSRPTNPTGNILPLEDIQWIEERTKKNSIPLLIDLAYGNPFPNLIAAEEPITYKDGRTLSLSFSKIGLPGVRLGIVMANPETIEILSSYAAVGNLAVGNLGVYMMEFLFQKNILPELAKNVLRPFYEKKLELATSIFESEFKKYGVEYEIHDPMGGFFLWIRFPNLSISNHQLYHLCKDKRLFIVSGHYFFPGLNSDFSHTKECIRLTYCRKEEELARGAHILAEIVASHQAKSK